MHFVINIFIICLNDFYAVYIQIDDENWLNKFNSTQYRVKCYNNECKGIGALLTGLAYCGTCECAYVLLCFSHT